MSRSLLIIPEDPFNNGYILKPLFERMAAELGKTKARVQVLSSPRMRGYDHAVATMKSDLAAAYKHFDLWIFCPDADKASAGAMSALENELRGRGVQLFCCPAVTEVEAWLLAGHSDMLADSWNQVRENPRLKEVVFEPFLRQYGDPRAAGGGRAALMSKALASYAGILQRCPELRVLQDRLEESGILK